MSRVCDVVREGPAQLCSTSKYSHKLFQEWALKKIRMLLPKIILCTIPSQATTRRCLCQVIARMNTCYQQCAWKSIWRSRFGVDTSERRDAYCGVARQWYSETTVLQKQRIPRYYDSVAMHCTLYPGRAFDGITECCTPRIENRVRDTAIFNTPHASSWALSVAEIVRIGSFSAQLQKGSQSLTFIIEIDMNKINKQASYKWYRTGMIPADSISVVLAVRPIMCTRIG